MFHALQGFQLLKNGKSYGSVIPSDVRSMHVKGLKLGDKVELQLTTLNNRAPAGNQPHKNKSNCIVAFYSPYYLKKFNAKVNLHITSFLKFLMTDVLIKLNWCTVIRSHWCSLITVHQFSFISTSVMRNFRNDVMCKFTLALNFFILAPLTCTLFHCCIFA